MYVNIPYTIKMYGINTYLSYQYGFYVPIAKQTGNENATS